MPKQYNFKLWSEKRNFKEEALVSELINKDTKQQKQDVIFTSINLRLYKYESPNFLETPR